MTRIYTRTGDAGETALIGGRRVPKDHPRVEAYGTLDELNAALGAARAALADQEIGAILGQRQQDLFALSAAVAAPSGQQANVRPLTRDQVTELETLIDRFDATLPPLRRFILSGGAPAGALLHVARTISRRAERRLVTLARSEQINPEILRYINRLSDLLFVLARTVNRMEGAVEQEWHSAET